MYVDVVQSDDSHGTVWYRTPDRELHMEEVPLPFYYYDIDPDGDHTTLYGEPAKRVDFSNAMLYNNAKYNRVDLFESDISPIHKFLSDTFYGQDGPLNVGYFDIEVDYDLKEGKGYPSPEDPFGVINSFSLFDAVKQEYHMVMLTNDKTISIKDDMENLPVHCHHCVTEKQLIDTALKLVNHLDFLSAWNGDQFDVPYIMARCVRLYGLSNGMRKFSRGGFKTTTKTAHDDFRNEYTEYRWSGRNHLDLMRLYKKFSFEVKRSYSLDNVCIDELGVQKVTYDGDLGELYRTDPQKFFEYSFHDSRLLKMLDEKKGIIETGVRMARQATLRYDEIFGSIMYLEGAVRNYAHHDREKPLVLPDRNRDNVRESFPGAYVFESRTGVYNWVQSIDLASLYPSVIRAINISPETHKLQCVNGHTDFVKIVEGRDEMIDVRVVRTGEVERLSAKDVKDFMRAENFTISSNGSIFDNNEEGLIPEILKKWYKTRKEMKAKAKECELAGNKEDAKYFDKLQHIMKINLNSMYGAISNPFCRFFTLDCAKSITLTGQDIEKYQAWKADQIMKEEVKKHG